jgi:release factor glutamine methyltransferase
MKAFEIIKIGSKFLKENKIPSSILDSEILLSKTLNKTREEILTNIDQKIDKKKVLLFKKYLQRRSKNEPIAYILGEKEFWSSTFYVNKNTLIPRPETELLVDNLLEFYRNKNISILDIGTGSGCIVISLLNSLNRSNGIGVDVCKNAIITAKKNGIKFNLQNRLKFFNKSFINIFNQKFDLIVSNPPYIMRKDIKNLSDDIKRYEPRIALDGGNDGLDLIKKVIYKSKEILKINGTLALEIGNEQIKKVSKILIGNNFRIKNVIKDYKSNVRCIVANYNN